MSSRPWLAFALLVTACAAPPLRGGPQHPRWQAIGGGPAADRLIVGSRYDPTGRVDGYFQGDRRISLAELLDLTGHGDIAARMAWRGQLKPALEITGAVLAAAGLTYALTAGGCTYVPPNYDEYDRCNDDLHDRRVGGGAIAATGAALATIGWLIPLGRPSGQEISYWAAGYNHAHHIPPIPPPQAVQVSATAAANGGGLVVRGAF